MPAATTKPKLKVSPPADRVAVKPLEVTRQMRGGLHIPDSAKEKPFQGDVIAVGPGRLEKGERVPKELQVGTGSSTGSTAARSLSWRTKSSS